jgi:hypothetical protein
MATRGTRVPSKPTPPGKIIGNWLIAGEHIAAVIQPNWKYLGARF